MGWVWRKSYILPQPWISLFSFPPDIRRESLIFLAFSRLLGLFDTADISHYARSLQTHTMRLIKHDKQDTDIIPH